MNNTMYADYKMNKEIYEDLLSMGLTEERLTQMLRSWNGDIEQVYTVVEDWGVEKCNKGYDIFNYDGIGLFEIEAINDVDAFDDEEATKAAIKDGIKIIPIDELPENFDRKFFGWIDTPENRKAIEDYCKDPTNYYCNGNSK